jgi:uncharacterized protein
VSSNLTEEELAALMPSELCQYQTPIPTQIVSSDEFYPDPQNERQREVETRLLAMADDLGGKQGLNRRKFFQTAAGMAASFVAMNDGNNAKLYNVQPKRAMQEIKGDRFAQMKAEYEKAGPEPSNVRYGYVVPVGTIDHGVFA